MARGRTRVRPHTRNGRRVKAHPRKLGPRRAGRNALRSWRSARRKRHSDAVVYGSLALAEIGAWLTLRGTALALTTAAIVLLGLGLAARRAAH